MRIKRYSKIKVAFVIPSLINGGAEKSLLDICKFIDVNAFDITLITFWKGDELQDEFKKLNSNNIISLNCRSRYDIRIFFKLIKIFKSLKFDIIHSNMQIANIYSILCKPFIQSKFVTSQHSVLKKSGIFHELNRLLTNLNDFVISNSKYTTKFLVNLRYCKKEKIRTIYLGLNFNKLERRFVKSNNLLKELNVPKSAFVCGYVGTFKIEKGHKFLIRAMKPVLEMNENIILILVGSGKLMDDMIRLSEELKIYSQIRFVGNRYNVSDYLSIMHLFISTSIYESFGISIIEAMYKKVPVIAFNTGGVAETIINGDTGLLVEKNNVKMMSDVIGSIISNYDLVSTNVLKAFDFVKKNYDIRITVTQLEKFYKSIIV